MDKAEMMQREDDRVRDAIRLENTGSQKNRIAVIKWRAMSAQMRRAPCLVKGEASGDHI